ncbi:hypothetical protein VNO78_33225 [Psophocarpus tetragonolobus]|uniref:Uncharacterized protein n=1 Tax=Psophocarpus tetragonolobus TaxID=3891 RepID=A0AAN9NXY3_PSOTE
MTTMHRTTASCCTLKSCHLRATQSHPSTIEPSLHISSSIDPPPRISPSIDPPLHVSSFLHFPDLLSLVFSLKFYLCLLVLKFVLSMSASKDVLALASLEVDLSSRDIFTYLCN